MKGGCFDTGPRRVRNLGDSRKTACLFRIKANPDRVKRFHAYVNENTDQALAPDQISHDQPACENQDGTKQVDDNENRAIVILIVFHVLLLLSDGRRGVRKSIVRITYVFIPCGTGHTRMSPRRESRSDDGHWTGQWRFLRPRTTLMVQRSG